MIKMVAQPKTIVASQSTLRAVACICRGSALKKGSIMASAKGMDKKVTKNIGIMVAEKKASNREFMPIVDASKISRTMKPR